MNLFEKILIILVVCSSSIAYGQNPYNVEFNEVKGSLKSTDKYKKDFGKYRGFELELFEGEKANFAVFSSDFNARMILVDPTGKVFKQSEEARQGIASIITNIPISGDWILYVIGGQNDKGEFALRYAFAASNSINIINNMDLCSSLNFLIAHTTANFMLLPFEQLESSGMELIGKTDRTEFNEKNGSFIITKYAGANEISAKMKYNSIIERFSNCIGDWEIGEFKSTDTKATEKVEGKLFTCIVDKKVVQIFVELFSLSGVTDESKSNYEILITIK